LAFKAIMTIPQQTAPPIIVRDKFIITAFDAGKEK
jgi:hypothetical protein